MQRTPPYIIRTLPSRWRGIIYHEALVIPDRATGEPMALDITMHSVTPRSLTLAQFEQEYPTVIRYRDLPSLNQSATWDNFDRLRNSRRYDVVFYNCDHFLDDVLSYKPHSEQLLQKLAIAVGFLLLLVVGLIWVERI